MLLALVIRPREEAAQAQRARVFAPLSQVAERTSSPLTFSESSTVGTSTVMVSDRPTVQPSSVLVPVEATMLNKTRWAYRVWVGPKVFGRLVQWDELLAQFATVCSLIYRLIFRFIDSQTEALRMNQLIEMIMAELEKEISKLQTNVQIPMEYQVQLMQLDHQRRYVHPSLNTKSCVKNVKQNGRTTNWLYVGV